MFLGTPWPVRGATIHRDREHPDLYVALSFIEIVPLGRQIPVRHKSRALYPNDLPTTLTIRLFFHGAYIFSLTRGGKGIARSNESVVSSIGSMIQSSSTPVGHVSMAYISSCRRASLKDNDPVLLWWCLPWNCNWLILVTR